jgi:AraC family transcriptional regulator
MKARLAEDISLGKIAAAANLSPSHFARSFGKAKGISPHRFLVQLRLEKARELLRATKVAIVDISAEVGYPDPGYLARVFRRELGITPAAYRREHRT